MIYLSVELALLLRTVALYLSNQYLPEWEVFEPATERLENEDD